MKTTTPIDGAKTYIVAAVGIVLGVATGFGLLTPGEVSDGVVEVTALIEKVSGFAIVMAGALGITLRHGIKPPDGPQGDD